VTNTAGGAAVLDLQNNVALVGFALGGHAYVTIDGVIGSAAFGGSTSYGIRVTNIGGCSGSTCGYCVQDGSTPGNVKVLHLECYGTSFQTDDDSRGGIFLSGSGGGPIEVGYSWIHGPAATSGGTNQCFPGVVNTENLWCGTGMRIFNGAGAGSTYTLILEHDNRVANLFEDGIGNDGNATVWNNEISHVYGSGHSDSIEIQNWSYEDIHNNYIHESNDQNIFLDCTAVRVCNHTRVYNNIIDSNPGHGGINMAPEPAGSSINDVEIINNTFYASSTYNIWWPPAGGGSGNSNALTNLVILNNIFGTNGNAWVNLQFGSSAQNTMASATSWDYNSYSTLSPSYPVIAYYGSGAGSNQTLVQLQAESPARETHGETCNVSFTNTSTSWVAGDFTLASSDTCAKGKGINLNTAFGGAYNFTANDLSGNPRPATGAWDMGAYQSGSGGTASNPAPPSQLTATVQ
jgi:hypothetical protein